VWPEGTRGSTNRRSTSNQAIPAAASAITLRFTKSTRFAPEKVASLGQKHHTHQTLAARQSSTPAR